MTNRIWRRTSPAALLALVLASPGAAAQDDRVAVLIEAAGQGDLDGCERAARSLAARGEGSWLLACAALDGSREAMEQLGASEASQVTPALVAALGSDDDGVRSAAADTLGYVSAPAGVGALVIALSDASHLVRAAAAEAIGRLGDSSVAEALVPLLRDDVPGVRWAAAASLEQLGDPLGRLIEDSLAGSRSARQTLLEDGDDRVAPVLRRVLLGAEEDSVRRLSAASMLGEIGDAESKEALITVLGDPVGRVRQAAALALSELGEPWALDLVQSLDGSEEARERLVIAKESRAMDVLLRLLDDVPAAVQIAAVGTLAETGDPVAFDPLRRLFWTGPHEIRQPALEALAEIDRARVSAELLSTLRGGRPDRRVVAAEALGILAEAQAVEALEEATRYFDADVRAAAAQALGQIAATEAVPELLSLLEDSDAEVRAAAATALGATGDAVAVDPLYRALGDRNDQVRAAAGSALAQLGEPQGLQIQRSMQGAISAAIDLATSQESRAFEPLVTLFRHSQDRRARVASIRALGMISPEEGMDVLIEALADGEPAVRALAAEDLARVGDRRAVEPLMKLVADDEPAPRRWAVRALGSIGDPRAIEVVVTAAAHSDPWTREAAAWALGEFADPRAAVTLRELVIDPVAQTRIATCWALGRIGDEESVPALVRRLRDEVPEVRQAAVWALGRLGGRDAVDGLLGAVVREEEDIMREAREALDRLDEPLGKLIVRSVGGSHEAMRELAASDGTRALVPLVNAARWGTSAQRRFAVRTLAEIGSEEAIEEIVSQARSWNPLHAGYALLTLPTAGDRAGRRLMATARALVSPLCVVYLPALLLVLLVLVRRARERR